MIDLHCDCLPAVDDGAQSAALAWNPDRSER
jgi:tyrosine-protein phosphatase YwqE